MNDLTIRGRTLAEQQDRSAPGKSNYRPQGVDALPCPDHGRAPDGKWVPIAEDERLPQLFAIWSEDACKHSQTAVVLCPDSLGRPQYFRHCLDCGHKLSSALPHGQLGTVSDLTREDMERLSEAYDNARRAELEKITRAAAERVQVDSRESYDDYLRSDAWKRKRDLILKRDGGTCQGCLSRPASEVHHLTYAHIREEFAFELVALCGPCHARFHEAA